MHFHILCNFFQKVAQSSKAWVLTGGINKGLTKYIGEALRETTMTDQSQGRNTVCMGITPWNNIKNRSELLGEDAKPDYHIPRTFSAQDKYLDNNHTHFLMVDNNYAENHNKEVDFSANLVTAITQLQHEGIRVFSNSSKYFTRILFQGILIYILFTLLVFFFSLTLKK